MKKIIFAALLVLGLSAVAQTTTTGTIERVTVFPSGALVEKCAVVRLQKGENRIVIRGNAVNISDGTLQFASSDDWFISSSHMNNSDVPENVALSRVLPAASFTQYQTLSNKLNELQQKINNNNDLIAALTLQHSAIFNLKAIQRTNEFDTVDKIKSQFEFQRKELMNINNALDKARKENTDYTFQSKTTKDEMARIVAAHTGGSKFYPNQIEIEVCIFSERVINNAKIKYSYHVDNSQCVYSYDVMLNELTKKAVFCLKGNVQQNTGEHWRDCEIVFATSEAGYAGFDRMLPTYYLNYIPQPAPTNGLARATMANTYVYAEEESVDTKALKKARTSNYVKKQDLTLSREFVLNNSQTIASGAGAQMMLLSMDSTVTSFARFATPKNEEKVHYTALLPEWESLGLLDVDCNVYLNNKYVSHSAIITSGTGDTMRFAVGEDQNVKVGRKVHRTTPDRTGILSKEVDETMKIVLTIKNTKSESIDISLKDQIPISRNSEIKVMNVQTSNGDLDKDTGIVRWLLHLEPREEKSVTLTYTVRYPKDKMINLY